MMVPSVLGVPSPQSMVAENRLAGTLSAFVNVATITSLVDPWVMLTEATGAITDGLLTAVIVMTKVCGAEVSEPPLAVPPLSRSRTTTLARPTAPGAGVKLKVPSAATAGWAENNALLSFETRNVSAWPASPALMPAAHRAIDCGPESSATAWSAPLRNDGVMLIALIVIANVWGADMLTPPLNVPPLSWTRSVKVEVPEAPGAGR